ncbi:MAG: DNA repair protein RecN [Desulfurellaceae bacterium]|nr:DNA repair protein RecN [Desulfurellaceae bacterium]
MLRSLHITNFALIDELELSFENGLNVITGETGAGKSLLMQALGLAVGGRASAELVRHKAHEAVVEALFDIHDYPDHSIARLLEDGGYPVEDEILIRRVISHTGRGRVYCNGALTTVGLLRRLGVALLQVHGQHEQHSLLEAEAAQTLLDGFGGLGPNVAEMQQRYSLLRRAWAQRQALVEGRREREDRRELLRFQLEEIARAELRAGEEEDLRQEKTVLLHAEKLQHGVAGGEHALASGEDALTDRLGRILSQIQDCARLDERLSEVLELLQGGLAQLEEAALSLHRYGQRLAPDPERLEEIDARLAVLSRLKKKYGPSVEAVLARHQQLSRELAGLDRSEESLAAQDRAVADAAAAAWLTAHELSAARRRAAHSLEARMGDELAGLGMRGARFGVRFADQPDVSPDADDPPDPPDPFVHGQARLGPAGCDRLEFFLSANPGEPALPLVRVASGGELSRLMLALKALSVEAREAPTLIFDEVDAGVGGGVAEVVGRRLRSLAVQRQVLCITHLPQIAAFAEHAYTVVKTVTQGRSVSTAKSLTRGERLDELARMLGGLEVSAEAKRHAREMLDRAARAG